MREKCSECGGSGELRDARPELTEEEREMLDSTRCYDCFGTGYADGDGELAQPNEQPGRWLS